MAKAKWIPAIYLMVCAALWAAIAVFGWNAPWQALQIRVFQQEFSDLRTSQAAVIALKMGLDPTVNNAIGANNSLYNHPPILLSIARLLRFDLEWAFLTFATVSIALFTYINWLWLRRNPSWTLLLATLSGAALLPIERLNNDMHIYMLLVAATLSNHYIVRPMLLGVSAILKIFPAVAFLALLPWRSHFRNWPTLMMTATAVAIGPFLLYLALDWSYIFKAISLTERGAASAYGVWVNHFLVEERFMPLPYGQQIQYVAYLLFAVMIFRARKPLARWAGVDMTRSTDGLGRHEFAFLTGASIYVFTYLVSANWDYRMIFTLLAVPYFLSLENRTVRVAFSSLLILALNYYILVGALGNLGGAINIAAKLGLHLMMLAALIIVPLQLQAQAQAQVQTRDPLANA